MCLIEWIRLISYECLIWLSVPVHLFKFNCLEINRKTKFRTKLVLVESWQNLTLKVSLKGVVQYEITGNAHLREGEKRLKGEMVDRQVAFNFLSQYSKNLDIEHRWCWAVRKRVAVGLVVSPLIIFSRKSNFSSIFVTRIFPPVFTELAMHQYFSICNSKLLSSKSRNVNADLCCSIS